jgi:hypothetical protein
MTHNIKRSIVEFYLDWFNNFISYEAMAEHYNLEVDQVKWLVMTGRGLNDESL